MGGAGQGYFIIIRWAGNRAGRQLRDCQGQWRGGGQGFMARREFSLLGDESFQKQCGNSKNTSQANNLSTFNGHIVRSVRGTLEKPYK